MNIELARLAEGSMKKEDMPTVDGAFLGSGESNKG
jgi:hypothetical protein